YRCILYNTYTHSTFTPVTLCFLFFFNDPATTEIYTLSLHDALPICQRAAGPMRAVVQDGRGHVGDADGAEFAIDVTVRQRHRHRSEEHTSELQSQSNLVCRLLLEKKKKNKNNKKTHESN